MTVLEFNYQITTFQDKLKAFAHSLTNNKEDAQDLFQETILRALKYQDKFVSPTSLKAWLYTIMRNTFINEYRRQRLAQRVYDYTPNEYILSNVPAKYNTPYSKIETNEILNSIDTLEEDYKVPFLQHFNGFKYKEIAEMLDLPIGTVKSRIFIARQKLMKQLSEFA